MLFTKETDYALRFFRELSDGERHSVGDITEKQFIPKQFAYKILRKLVQAELVTATRGINGGCRLNKELKEITLYDVMKVMEKKSFLVACMENGFVCPYKESNCGICNIHNNLIPIEMNLIKELQNHNVYDLIKD